MRKKYIIFARVTGFMKAALDMDNKVIPKKTKSMAVKRKFKCNWETT